MVPKTHQMRQYFPRCRFVYPRVELLMYWRLWRLIALNRGLRYQISIVLVLILSFCAVLLLPSCRPTPVVCSDLHDSNARANLAAHIRFLTDPSAESQPTRTVQYISNVLGSPPETRTLGTEQSALRMYLNVSAATASTRYWVDLRDRVAVAIVLELGAMAGTPTRQVGWGLCATGEGSGACSTDHPNPSARGVVRTTVSITMNGCGDNPAASRITISADGPMLPHDTHDTVAQFATPKKIVVEVQQPGNSPSLVRPVHVQAVADTTHFGGRKCNLALEHPPLVDWLDLFARLGGIVRQNTPERADHTP